jgi:ATP-binding cassette subfamily B protein
MIAPVKRKLMNLVRRIKERLRLFSALVFVWESAPRWTIANIALTVIQGVLPLASLYLMKVFVDRVTYGVTGNIKISNAFHNVLIVVVWMAGLSLVSALVALLGKWITTNQSILVSDHMQDVIHAQSIAVDMEYYENPEFYNKLQRAQREAPTRPLQILNNLTTLGQSSLMLTGVVALLMTFHWSIAIVLLLTVLPSFAIRIHFSRVMYAWQRERTETDRMSQYLNWLLIGNFHAKEIRLFDLGDVLLARYREIRKMLHDEQIRLTLRQSLMGFGAQIVTSIVIYGSYAYIAYKTLQGSVTLGSLVMYYQALQRGQGALGQFLGGIAGLHEDNLFVVDLYEFLNIKPKILSPADPRPVPSPMAEKIEFHQVNFNYPMGSRKALEDINLTIYPGEKVALVGENGSGKTTLIKLLCRLYDPEEGHITVDGIDLREFDVVAWRRQVGVILQDYAQYNLSARENIWFGNVDLPLDTIDVTGAAQRAGADEVLRRLPKGYDTVLGKLFQEGEQLSIGEWQKIALARAFVRDSQLIILDEPTSALDARAEHHVFERIHEFADGRTVILISHRFSTVYMADRIIVFDHGRIVEQGSHAELMRIVGGKYRHMFNLQAKHYQLTQPDMEL